MFYSALFKWIPPRPPPTVPQPHTEQIPFLVSDFKLQPRKFLLILCQNIEALQKDVLTFSPVFQMERTSLESSHKCLSCLFLLASSESSTGNRHFHFTGNKKHISCLWTVCSLDTDYVLGRNTVPRKWLHMGCQPGCLHHSGDPWEPTVHTLALITFLIETAPIQLIIFTKVWTG